MLKISLIALSAACAVSFSAFAEEGRIMSKEEMKALYPTTQEIYEDCKAAVKLYETDKKGFMRSYCVAQISGYLVGIYRMAPIQRVSSLGKEDSCNEVYEKIYRQYESIVCIPNEWLKSRKMPVEYRVANDFLSYVERNKHLFQKNGSWDSPKEGGLAADISLIFSCTKTQYK